MMWMLSMLLNTAQAEETPLISGELSGTGHTLRAGDNQLYLGTVYARGLTAQMEVGANALALIDGPNVFAEYALMQSDENAFSIGASASASWNFSSLSASVSPTYTIGGQRSDRINIGLSYQLNRFSDDVSTSTAHGLPLRFSYDWLPSKQTTVRFLASSNVAALLDGQFTFTTGAVWYHGWNRFRIGAGLLVTNAGLQDLQEIADLFEFEGDLPAVYPLPYLRMWWRF